MKRYFYPPERQHHAWCMHVDHGMRFVDCNGLSVSPDPGMWGIAVRHGTAARLYIHPDSMHLLEPREGDVCSFPSRTAWGEEDSECHDYLTYSAPMHGWLQIIQRYGKPFFWPESEVV